MKTLAQLISDLCPNGVPYKKLGEISLMKRGTSATKKTINQGDIPVISGGIKPAFFCDTANREGETVTVAGSGAGAGLVLFWNQPIFVCDAFSVQGKDNVCTKYLYYVMKNMQERIQNTKKGAGVPHVHIKDIEDFEIPVPPIEVQEKIVEILDKFTALTVELQAELQERQRQYEYYRNRLLSFGGSDNIHSELIDTQTLTPPPLQIPENE